MIKEAIKYITDLKAEAMEPKVVTIAGKTYCDKDLSRYDDEPMGCKAICGFRCGQAT